MKNARPGLFIVIEGLDGAGTTTQSQRLAERLSAVGQRVHRTCEPSTGEIGKLARRYLSGELASSPDLMALIFAADRIDHVQQEILPQLRSGVHVISDRYVHSSLVYQGEDLDAGFSTTWVEELNARAHVPDVTFFIHIPLAVSLERIGERESKDIYESESQLKIMEARYDHVMRSLKKRGDCIVNINGQNSIEAIEKILFEDIQRRLA